MFHDFRKSMAVCVMVFILLGGCSDRGRTVETVRTAESRSGELSTDVSSFPEKDDISDEYPSLGTDSCERKSKDAANAAGAESPAKKTFIYIHVCGAVNAPGVVKVPEGSRVYEAIEKAGGLSQDADSRYINQARLLSDGEQICVPTREETASVSMYPPENISGGGEGGSGPEGEQKGAAPGTDAEGRVNINTADSALLQTLTGIGESRAEAIILYRETNGPFETIEDIMKVTGIKNALFNNIKDDITVG